MRGRVVLVLAVLVLVGLSIAGPPPAAAQWKPAKPITVIVPWAAGGITDQVVRVTAGEIERALGQKLVVVNQPGASGSVGTKNVLDAAKDGYTWASGAPHDLGAYKVLGMLETTIQDWHLFIVAATGTIVSVNPNTPYKDMGELLAAMRANPGQVSVGTAGQNSSGHLSIETIAQAAGLKYKHVPYDGGNPAVIATVAGETQVTTQLAPEQAEMIRAKRLRPLAVVATSPLELEGFGTIEPITKFVPTARPKVNYIGIFLPKGVPREVVDTLQGVWTTHVAKSDAVRKWAANRGALPVPMTGDEAFRVTFPTVQNSAWLYFEAGKAKVSPDTVGIPRPQ
jgi:tripartite-type tricarboxylate transporter receptor subunit TctC